MTERVTKPRCSTECAEDFRRLQSEKTTLILAATRKSEFRWLIEAPGLRYLAARQITTSHNFYWTQDHDKALYFMSEAQADAVMMAVRQIAPELFGFALTLGDAKAVEHEWSKP